MEMLEREDADPNIERFSLQTEKITKKTIHL